MFIKLPMVRILEDEELWYEDRWIASRMPQILKELKAKYPDFDTDIFLRRAEDGFIPNPIKLEETGKKENIVLAGLIHREYTLTLLAGVVGVNFDDSGRALIMHENRQIDVTDELIEILPNLASACGLSIKNLSVDEKWEKDIDELMNIVSLILYISVFLRSTEVIESVLSIFVFVLTGISNKTLQRRLGERIYRDLNELGLEKIGRLFVEAISPSS